MKTQDQLYLEVDGGHRNLLDYMYFSNVTSTALAIAEVKHVESEFVKCETCSLAENVTRSTQVFT